MINDELFPPLPQPLIFRLREGFFVSEVEEYGELVAETLEGKFIAISETTWKGYSYFSLRLQDETNEIQVIFPQTSGTFKDLVCSLAYKRFSYVRVEAYREARRNRLRTYLDEALVFPMYIQLPSIKRKRDGRGKPYYCDYSERMKRLKQIANEITLSNT